jgi:hypothetical protein
MKRCKCKNEPNLESEFLKTRSEVNERKELAKTTAKKR